LTGSQARLPPLEIIALFTGDAPRLNKRGQLPRGPRNEVPSQARAVTAAEVALARYLARPAQPLTASERAAAEAAQGALWWRCDAPADARLRLRAGARWIARMQQIGAVAILLPAARKILGPTALTPALPALHVDPDAWLTLFVQQYALFDEGSAWCHTHGMEHFGLPDLECRTAAGDLPRAERLIQAAIDHLLASGAGGLAVGQVVDAVESDGSGSIRFRVAPATEVPGHEYGPCGTLQLVPEPTH